MRKDGQTCTRRVLIGRLSEFGDAIQKLGADPGAHLRQPGQRHPREELDQARATLLKCIAANARAPSLSARERGELVQVSVSRSRAGVSSGPLSRVESRITPASEQKYRMLDGARGASIAAHFPRS